MKHGGRSRALEPYIQLLTLHRDFMQRFWAIQGAEEKEQALLSKFAQMHANKLKENDDTTKP